MTKPDLRTFAEAGTVMDDAAFTTYQHPGRLVDSDHPAIRAKATELTRGLPDPVAQAVKLYYFVRDEVRYDPYGTPMVSEAYRASTVLAQGHGYCINKAGLMAALARAVGIPARLGYADVRNHLTTKKMAERMGTDVFYFHGYTDLWLPSIQGGRWVKATPAFNIELTDKFRLKPLEFDGREDSIYHPFDQDGRAHMQYLAYRGVYADIPFETIKACFAAYYPHHRVADPAKMSEQRDFAAEVDAEARAES